MENCFASLLKYLLFVTNFLVFSLGVIVLGFSIFAYVDGETLQDLINLGEDDWTINVYGSASILMMAVSVIVILVSFFGCCGAIKESKCLLGIYVILVGSLFVASIAGAVIAKDQDIKAHLEKPLYKTLRRYNNQANQGTDDWRITQNWDEIMEGYTCCGIDTYEDWANENPNFDLGEIYHVPLVCCQNIVKLTSPDNFIENCRRNPVSHEKNPDFKGCSTKLFDEVYLHQDYVFYAAIALMIFMVLNLIIATATCCGIKDGRFV